MATANPQVATEWGAWLRALEAVLSMAWPDLLVQDLIPTLLLGGLAYQAMSMGYPFTAIICTAGITIINGVTLDQLFRSVAETKRDDREAAERERAAIQEQGRD